MMASRTTPPPPPAITAIVVVFNAGDDADVPSAFPFTGAAVGDGVIVCDEVVRVTITEGNSDGDCDEIADGSATAVVFGVIGDAVPDGLVIIVIAPVALTVTVAVTTVLLGTGTCGWAVVLSEIATLLDALDVRVTDFVAERVMLVLLVTERVLVMDGLKLLDVESELLDVSADSDTVTDVEAVSAADAVTVIAAAGDDAKLPEMDDVDVIEMEL